jgi:NAD-dependent SIR2 family protein deacetylase
MKTEITQCHGRLRLWREFRCLTAAYEFIAAGVSFIDPTHFNTNFLSKSFRITETAHMFIIIGGSILIHSTFGTEKSNAAAITFEYV